VLAETKSDANYYWPPFFAESVPHADISSHLAPEAGERVNDKSAVAAPGSPCFDLVHPCFIIILLSREEESGDNDYDSLEENIYLTLEAVHSGQSRNRHEQSAERDVTQLFRWPAPMTRGKYGIKASPSKFFCSY
jgi:hypothetical protein